MEQSLQQQRQQFLVSLAVFRFLPWLTTSYLLAQVTTMAVYGKLGDIYGRRRVFVIAVSTFMVGSMMCGLAQSMPMLIGTRVIQGIGAGGITRPRHGAYRRCHAGRQTRSLPRLHGSCLRSDGHLGSLGWWFSSPTTSRGVGHSS